MQVRAVTAIKQLPDKGSSTKKNHLIVCPTDSVGRMTQAGKRVVRSRSVSLHSSKALVSACRKGQGQKSEQR